MSTIIMNNNNTSNKMRVKLDEDRFEEVQISYIKSGGRQQEGINTQAIGEASHSEGYNTIAEGKYSHAEGDSTIASGYCAHAEGGPHGPLDRNTIASGHYSHAEGDGTEASGIASHTEGEGTTASARGAHAEGYQTKASGVHSHAEGSQTVASNDRTHAEGYDTMASGDTSHAEGYRTIAASEYQHVQGKYNVEDANNTYAHIVGNGSAKSRSNAHTIKWNGDAWFAGNVTVGAGNGNKLATEEYVNSAIEAIEPYELPQATASVLGGVKTGYTGNEKNYAVNLNNNGQMYVTVPWTDTNDNTTYTFSTGESNGQIKITPSSGNPYNVSVQGLGSAAYLNTPLVAGQDGHNFQIKWDKINDI